MLRGNKQELKRIQLAEIVRLSSGEHIEDVRLSQSGDQNKDVFVEVQIAEDTVRRLPTSCLSRKSCPSRVSTSQAGYSNSTSSSFRVCLVDLIYPVGFVHRVSLVQPNRRDRPDRPNRPNEQDRLTDFSTSWWQREQIWTYLPKQAQFSLFHTHGDRGKDVET